MEISIPFWQYWYFHVPNYVLAALIYTLLGRFVLGLFVPAEWENYIWRTFLRLTDWVVRLAAYLTPMMVPRFLLPPIAAFWLFVARAVLAVVLIATGLGPELTPDPN